MEETNKIRVSYSCCLALFNPPVAVATAGQYHNLKITLVNFTVNEYKWISLLTCSQLQYFTCFVKSWIKTKLDFLSCISISQCTAKVMLSHFLMRVADKWLNVARLLCQWITFTAHVKFWQALLTCCVVQSRDNVPNTRIQKKRNPVYSRDGGFYTEWGNVPERSL